MVIQVHAKVCSGKPSVVLRDGIYVVSTKSSPVKNMANIELIKLLSSYFNISKSSVKILKGVKSKKKIIEIQEE